MTDKKAPKKKRVPTLGEDLVRSKKKRRLFRSVGVTPTDKIVAEIHHPASKALKKVKAARAHQRNTPKKAKGRRQGPKP